MLAVCPYFGLRFAGGSTGELWEISKKTRWLLPEGEMWIYYLLFLEAAFPEPRLLGPRLNIEDLSEIDCEQMLRVCPGEDQAGGDNAQITDLAQTWHKC